MLAIPKVGCHRALFTRMKQQAMLCTSGLLIKACNCLVQCHLFLAGGRSVLSPVLPLRRKQVDKHWYVRYLDKHEALAQYFCSVTSVSIT